MTSVFDTLLVHAGTLLTMAGPEGPRVGPALADCGIVRDGAVAMRDGQIVAVGTTRELWTRPGRTSATQVVDAGGRVVAPGFVDAHTHLPFAGRRLDEFERRARGESYAQILAAGGGIHATVRATREVSLEELVRLGSTYLDTMLALGSTTVEAKSGYGLELETELRQLEALRQLAEQHVVDVVPTFMGAHAIPPGQDADAYVDQLVSDWLPRVALRGLARYCDVFCEEGVFTPDQSERLLRAAREQGLGLKLHADELADTGGAALAARLGAASADHLHHANESGLRAMAAAGVIGVLLPGTALFLGMTHHAPARRMIEWGVPVALATDFNPGSCPSPSMALMMALAVTQLRLTPAEAWSAATLNAAHATGRAHRVGSLEPGKQADLVVWDTTDMREIPYTLASIPVHAVLKRGRLVSPTRSRPEGTLHA
jgi:imidazolonepropionase